MIDGISNCCEAELDMTFKKKVIGWKCKKCKKVCGVTFKEPTVVATKYKGKTKISYYTKDGKKIEKKKTK